MHQNLDLGIGPADPLDLLRRDLLMYVAEAVPGNDVLLRYLLGDEVRRLGTGSLYPVAEAATSSFDLLKRGALSFHNASTSGQNVKSADSVNHEHE